MNRQQIDVAAKIGVQLWVVLFWFVATFVVGVIVWALAGPTEAITIFVVAAIVFVAVPWRLAHRRR